MADTTYQLAMARAEHPAFHEELADVWGKRWGASDEVGVLRHVLLRRPGPELELIHADAWDDGVQALVDPNGRWYWNDRRPPDLQQIEAEHAGLVEALRPEGVEVTIAPPLGGTFVKAMYMRDPLITLPGGVIVTRMGVRMRRGEEPHAARLAANLGIPILATITGTGTLEGGSLIKLNTTTAALGTSIRCNAEGARQLRTHLGLLDIELIEVVLPASSIHLDLHLAMVDVDLALVDMRGLPLEFVDRLRRLGIETIPSPGGEPWAINLLCLAPRRVLIAAGNERTAELLSDKGTEIVELPYREIQKGGGGIHCSTVELIRDPGRGPRRG